MSEQELNQYESYLLQSKESVVSKTIKGTDSYYYFHFIQLLNEENFNLTEDDKKQLEDYSKFKTARAGDIKMRHLFMKYDQYLKSGSDDDRKKIFNELSTSFANEFEFAQPSDVKTSDTLLGETKGIISKLDPSIVDIEQFFEKSYTCLITFKQLELKALSQLDLQKLSASSQEIQTEFINTIGFELSTFQGVSQFIKIYFDNCFKKDKSFQLYADIFRKISLIQMDEILKLLPDLWMNDQYIGQLYLKKFQSNINNNSNSQQSKEEKELRLKQLNEIYAWTLSLPPKFESFSDQILCEMLQIGIDTNDYNFDLFSVYLKNPSRPYSNSNQIQTRIFQERKKDYQSQWHQYHMFDTSKWLNGTDLITKYLEEYFQKSDDYKHFEIYLEQQYLIKLLTKVRLYQGQEVSDITQIFDGPTLKSMNDQKLISICPYNKKMFSHGEPVKLNVELKNIPYLTIKIFEFCTENFYLKNSKEIDDSINLDGLIAQEQKEFKYTDPPIVKQVKEFSFENIAQKERGVFIIEFIGNGMSSRAIIKKGRLTLKEKLTVAGHVYQILDENLEVCHGTRTGIWMSGRFHSVNKDKEIIVPYVTSQQSYPITMVHEDFAYPGKVELLNECYDFRCSFFYSTESMLMSSKAKVLIQPKLFINSVPASLKLLSDAVITVKTENEHGIPSSMTFDKIELNYNEEIEVEFPISAKLKIITINITAKVDKLHSTQDAQNESKQTNKQTLTSSHSITFDNFAGKREFCSQFLKYSGDEGYEIYLLGKNGEPKSGVELNIKFTLKQKSTAIDTSLTTDEKGRVILGELKNISEINTSVRVQGDIQAETQQWQLENKFKMNYPENIKLIRGDPFKIPFLAKTINQKTVSLLSYFQNFQSGQPSVIKDFTKNLKLEGEVLILQGLDVGSYSLMITNPYKIIQIQILEGNYWKNTKLIVEKYRLCESRNEYKQLVLTNIQTTQTDQIINVKAKYLSDNPQSTRVHAFAVQFMPQGNVDLMAQDFKKQQIAQQEDKFIETQCPDNSYYSNKSLSDEQKYVMDRKNQERYVGNTLEKPQFLLKRQFIRDTDVTSEILQSEGAYDIPLGRNAQCKAMMSNRCFNNHSKRAYASQSRPQVNSFLNFLKYPSTVIGNKKLEPDGSVTFQIPNDQHATVFLVATNNHNLVLEIVPLKCNSFETRNLTQKSSMSQDKYYSIFRNQILLQKGGHIQFPDLTSTELQIVDQVTKLFTLMKELRKCANNGNEGFDTWEFLKRWDRLDFDEKHKLFDEHQCDELNLFIFFKDRAYFETYVKQYIANKMETSFVDHFLSQDRQKLLNHSKIENYSDLNVLEKVLLIIYFSELSGQEGDKQIAGDILQNLESLNKLQAINQKEYKKLFDTVLEAKTQEGNLTKTQDMRTQQSQQDQIFPMSSNVFGGTNQQYYQQPQQCFAQQYQPSSKQSQQYCFESSQNDGGSEAGDQLEEEYQDEYQDQYVEARKQFQQDFKNLEKTKEYAERHYLGTKNLDEHLDLVKLNGFWVDLAKHSIQKGVLTEPFISSKFIHCNENNTQVILVLALMNLPFESPSHKYAPFEGKGVSIQAASPAIVFTKEIKESVADLKLDILVAQRFYDPKDRYIYSDEDPNEKVEKEISEYIINKVYGCQVIVTNCSATCFDFQVLVEVPSGSIPVETLDYTKNHNITLDPYTTKTVEYFFYFPTAGLYKVYPANVARQGIVLAVAKVTPFQVNKETTKTNLETIGEILSKGSKQDILNFVATKNISNSNIFKLSDIFYLLKDKDFYLKLIEILRKKKIYDSTVWKFAFYHADHQSLKEYFSSREVQKEIGGEIKYFKCSLFEHIGIRYLEYYPLLSQRVHQLSQDRSNILNVQFKEQYIDFIHYLVQKNTHNLSDKLVFIYYLLLQERINEAIQIFKTIDQTLISEAGEARIQFDYFTAYLDFYIGFPNFIKAREVCEKYLDCPAIHWRNLFYEIVNQLTEYDGGVDLVKSEKVQIDDTKKKNKEGADREQVLQLTLKDHHLVLTHMNISEVIIQIFKIDLEVLFTRNPFISQSSEDFAYVKPNHVFTTLLEKSQASTNTTVDIPESFRKDNIFVQITSGDIKVQTTYFSTSLQVQILENYGQIKVQDQSGKYLSKIYIKTFAQEKSGKVIFYKDGYTDLRGRLDYASLNPESLGNIDKFAIFIMSDDLGSLIKEVKAPSKVGKYVEEVKLISKSWEAKQTKTRSVQQGIYEQNQQRYQK